jgi:hypothetical protein
MSTESERLLARLTQLVSEGLDGSTHRSMLTNFEELQRMHVEHPERLKQETAEASQS